MIQRKVSQPWIAKRSQDLKSKYRSVYIIACLQRARNAYLHAISQFVHNTPTKVDDPQDNRPRTPGPGVLVQEEIKLFFWHRRLALQEIVVFSDPIRNTESELIENALFFLAKVPALGNIDCTTSFWAIAARKGSEVLICGRIAG